MIPVDYRSTAVYPCSVVIESRNSMFVGDNLRHYLEARAGSCILERSVSHCAPRETVGVDWVSLIGFRTVRGVGNFGHDRAVSSHDHNRTDNVHVLHIIVYCRLNICINSQFNGLPDGVGIIYWSRILNAQCIFEFGVKSC